MMQKTSNYIFGPWIAEADYWFRSEKTNNIWSLILLTKEGKFYWSVENSIDPDIQKVICGYCDSLSEAQAKVDDVLKQFGHIS